LDGGERFVACSFKYARPYRWTTDVVVAPSLVPAKSVTPPTDGGFISGHTAEAFRDALAMGYLVPQRVQERSLERAQANERWVVVPRTTRTLRGVATTVQRSRLRASGSETAATTDIDGRVLARQFESTLNEFPPSTGMSPSALTRAMS
jgi:hypothetical protein